MELRYPAAAFVTALWAALLATVWTGLQGWLSVSLGLWLTANLFYLVSLRRFHQNKCCVSKRFVITVAILLRVFVVFSPPRFSDDVYRYWWEGKSQAEGRNPYTTIPGPTAHKVPVPEAPAAYGPVVVLAERLTYQLAAAVQPIPESQVPWMKLPAVLADLGILALLSTLSAPQLALYAWCPLPILEFCWNGHNDAIPVLLILAALLLARSHRTSLAFTALGLAIAAKWWPAILLPAFLYHHRRPKALLACAAAIILPAIPFLTQDPTLILENIRRVSGFLGGWRNNDSLFTLILAAAHGDPYLAKYLSTALISAAALVLMRNPLPTAALHTITAMLLLSANVHVWYLTWLLVPLVFTGPNPALLLWIALTPIHYRVLADWWTLHQWNGSTPHRWIVYVPVLTLLVLQAFRRPKPTSPTPA